ncbi:hypothetical protein TSOC_011487 [Tetrabaena socialis]|uniref:Uncharacterized protein n=1 Tax=Tetrabaena socialis TaxID=47790 RepID=A0A2J7ZQI7_9CHLO|nr:hypothetical protein TSOC_011487 [Tetrabaena socialis]|eukprot:PNH02531.1 hypothetical protein TSOC_011487 [Tetrabaena socialis]
MAPLRANKAQSPAAARYMPIVAITAALAGSVLSIALGVAGRRRSAVARRHDGKLRALSGASIAMKPQAGASENSHGDWAIQIFKPWSPGTSVPSSPLACKVKARHPANHTYKPIVGPGGEGCPSMFGNDVYDNAYDNAASPCSSGSACDRVNDAFEAWAAGSCGSHEAAAQALTAAAPSPPATPLPTSPSLLRMNSWATMSDLAAPQQPCDKPGYSVGDEDSSDSEPDEEAYAEPYGMLDEVYDISVTTLGNPLYNALACSGNLVSARRRLVFAGAVDNPCFAADEGNGEWGRAQGARAEVAEAAPPGPAQALGYVPPASAATWDPADEFQQQQQVVTNPWDVAAPVSSLVHKAAPAAALARAFSSSGASPVAVAPARAPAARVAAAAAVSRTGKAEAARPPFRPASKYTPPPPPSPRLPASAKPSPAKPAGARPGPGPEAGELRDGAGGASGLPSYMRPTQAFLASTVAGSRKALAAPDHTMQEDAVRQCAAVAHGFE